MSVKVNPHKNELLNGAKREFRNAGYILSDNKINSSSFDFIAKKSEHYKPHETKKMIIRVLAELDLFKAHTSQDLRLIAKLIQGNPLLIAKFATGKHIEPSTLYTRHDVPAMSLQTLKSFLQDERSKTEPKITQITRRGGIFVNLSTSRLTERRKQLGLDISQLAKKLGISRQSLHKYERGESKPKLDSYSRLIEIMGVDLDQPVEIFKKTEKDLDFAFKEKCKPKSSQQKEIAGYLEEKGIQILWFRKELFDGMFVNEHGDNLKKSKISVGNSVITGVTSKDEENDKNRLILLNKLSYFLGKKGIWFEDEESGNKSGTIKTTNFFTILSISDLERMKNEDLLKFLKRVNTS